MDFVNFQIEQLKSSNKEERQAAAFALGKVNDNKQAVINSLIDALAEPDEDVYRTIREALQKLGELAVLSVIQALNRPNPIIRSEAVYFFNLVRDARAVPNLIKLLKEDNNSEVRSVAAGMLGGILMDKRSVKPLIESLKDQDADVRYSAAISLGQLYYDEVLEAVEPLIQLLQDKDSNVRAHSAYALGQIGGDEVNTPLIPLLEDEDEDVRMWTTTALMRRNSNEVVEAVSKRLKDPSPKVRESAANTLRTLSSSKLAIDYLLKALEDEVAEVRYAAAETLGETANKRVLPALQLLKDKDTGKTRLGYAVKEAAATAIEYIRQRE